MVNEVGFEESTQFENVLQGVYRWNDGTIADYTNWRQRFTPGTCSPASFREPNDDQNAGTQDCVVIRSQTVGVNNCPDNGWADVGCNRAWNVENGYDFVCERRPTC